jgi:hypothetical protein
MFKWPITILRYILLFMMKTKLKRYKRDSEWYHKQTGYQPNWYDENGIPKLEREIIMLETTIEIERG